MVRRCRTVTSVDSKTKRESLETGMIERIESKRGEVFIGSCFKDLDGYDKVGRVLRGSWPCSPQDWL